jgi:hypothetical protein
MITPFSDRYSAQFTDKRSFRIRPLQIKDVNGEPCPGLLFIWCYREYVRA